MPHVPSAKFQEKNTVSWPNIPQANIQEISDHLAASCKSSQVLRNIPLSPDPMYLRPSVGKISHCHPHPLILIQVSENIPLSPGSSYPQPSVGKYSTVSMSKVTPAKSQEISHSLLSPCTPSYMSGNIPLSPSPIYPNQVFINITMPPCHMYP